MSETKHTPGPWEVGHNSHDVLASNLPSGKGPMKVCDIRGWGYLTGKGHGAIGLHEQEAIAVQNANARLIAAAPELLAHAKTVAFHLRRGDHKEPRAVSQMIDALEAVIVKASPQS